jgi:hypothetical protein
MADLLTLLELKGLLGIQAGDTRKDAAYSALLPVVSTAIRNYTERDFGAPLISETRTYRYDGSGYLDIDDAAAVTSVALKPTNAPIVTLDAEAWYPAPQRRDDAPVYYYLVIGPVSGVSPEMGFERNLDVLYREGRLNPVVSLVDVTGQWGWPVVPDDVKLAAAWTLQDWTTKPSNENLTGESIEDWSRQYARGPGSGPALAIPNRARDLLASYDKSST